MESRTTQLPKDQLPQPRKLPVQTRSKALVDAIAELHRQGFYRARIAVTGNVILERAHYDAVCAGAKPAKAPTVRNPFTPQLRLT